MDIACSHYKRDKSKKNLEKGEKEEEITTKKEKKQKEKPPIVVYSHGNAGCRMACFDEIPLCLYYGLEVFCFDFAGCGRSDGEKISLGYFEKKDLKACVEHLRENHYTRIGLWGRSMGAATTILYSSSLHRDEEESKHDKKNGKSEKSEKTDEKIEKNEEKMSNFVKCMIVDSPFTSIYDIAMYLATNQIQIRIPKFLLGLFAKIGINKLKNMILKQENFDIYQVSPLKYISHCKVPALFFAGKSDNLVPCTHSSQL